MKVSLWAHCQLNCFHIQFLTRAVSRKYSKICLTKFRNIGWKRKLTEWKYSFISDNIVLTQTRFQLLCFGRVEVCQLEIEWWQWIGNLIVTAHQIRQSFPIQLHPMNFKAFHILKLNATSSRETEWMKAFSKGSGHSWSSVCKFSGFSLFTTCASETGYVAYWQIALYFVFCA